ncbi:rhamnogalacturonan acetylesterase [Burkholderiaceae bacterium UC74_6]
MKGKASLLFGLALLSALCGAAHAAPRVILVGDSTMATKSGYGDALCAKLGPGVECVNLARGGRSTLSFRAEGLWEQMLASLKEGRSGETWVLIQFGHNDQPGKPGRSTDLVKDYPVNLTRYVSEVRAAGAHPILVTPLTRRSFRGPWLHDDLAPWAAAMRAVAKATKTPLLDLHALSAAAVQAMGEEEADTLAMAPRPRPGEPVSDATKSERAGAANPVFDRTHLGPKGADYFAAMVERELLPLAGPALNAAVRARR